MRTALLILTLLAAPAFAGQTVWKWVDEKGVTHYSDQPIPGAQRMEISGGSRSSTASAPATPSYSTRPQLQDPPAPGYRNFEILKPGNQDSIVNAGGVVDVRIGYEPGIQSGHSLYLYLDGRLIQDFPATGQEYTLRDVARGTHTLVAVIQDSRGKRIQETAAVSFTVRQESAAQPPVGPALRPPPKPRGQQTGNKLLKKQPSYAALNEVPLKIDPRTNKPVRP